GGMHQASLRVLFQRIKTLLRFTMPCIPDNDQRIVEEDTFRFGLTNVMFVRTLAAFAVVPVKTRDLVKVDHSVYAQYIQSETSMQYGLLFERLKNGLGTLVLVAAFVLLPPPAIAAGAECTPLH